MHKLAALTLAALLAFSPAIAQDKVWHHAGAFNGEPKYPEGFAKFDYVNPDAPIGGEVRLGADGGFDFHAAARFQYDRFTSLPVQQVGQQQARWACADDGDLR